MSSALIMRIEDMQGVLPPGLQIRFATPHPFWGHRWTTFSTGLAGVVLLPGLWCGQLILGCQVIDSDGHERGHYDIPFQFPLHTTSVLVLKIQAARASWWDRWIRGFLIEGNVPAPTALASRIRAISMENRQMDVIGRLGRRDLAIENDVEPIRDVTKLSS